MLELADHFGQRRGDQPLREPGRQQSGADDQHRKADHEPADRHLHRAEEFGFRHHRHQRPAGKGDRRQHRLICLAVVRDLAAKRFALARIVGAAGLADRVDRDGQQWMIGLERIQFVGVRIGRGDHPAAAVEQEGAGRFADGELRQEIRDPRQLDDDGEHTGALLLDVDRRGQHRGQPFAGGMGGQDRPVLVVGRHRLAKPRLVGDRVSGVLDAAVLEPDIVAGIFILIDPQPALGRDLEHLDAGIAELVPGEERAVRPAERDPGNGRLRLQLRQEHELPLAGVACVQHFFGQQRAHRGHRGPRLGRDRLQLVADRGDDLVVDGIGKGLADLDGGAPPQKMHADGADDDRRQDEGGNGAADADAHTEVLGLRS